MSHIEAPAPLIVFDLDGTLVDSAPDLVDSLNAILARDGIAPLPLERARKFVGRGGRVLIRLGYEAQGVELNDTRLETLFAAYLTHYEAHIADRTLPYPGAVAALDRLAQAGHRLAICTNKYEKPAKLLLRELGLTERFAAIVGADTFPVSKPNGAVLRLTVERAGGDPTRAIMVGDTATDVTAARNAGLPVIGVDFGYAPEGMEALNPDRVISHFDAIDAAVAALGAALPQAA
jgi:phosphoglycolate phosphatase